MCQEFNGFSTLSYSYLWKKSMEDFWYLDEVIIVIFSLMTPDERLPLSSSIFLKCMEINCLEIADWKLDETWNVKQQNTPTPSKKKTQTNPREKKSLHDSCTCNVKLAAHSQSVSHLAEYDCSKYIFYRISIVKYWYSSVKSIIAAVMLNKILSDFQQRLKKELPQTLSKSCCQFMSPRVNGTSCFLEITSGSSIFSTAQKIQSLSSSGSPASRIAAWMDILCKIRLIWHTTGRSHLLAQKAKCFIKYFANSTF